MRNGVRHARDTARTFNFCEGGIKNKARLSRTLAPS